MESKIVVQYCAETPTAQTALDIFKGSWKSALPAELGLTTGATEGLTKIPGCTGLHRFYRTASKT